MNAPEHINGTFVRHDWVTVAKGIAAGKTFVVEKHGKPEAVVVPPDYLFERAGGFELGAYLKKLKQMPARSLAEVNTGLARTAKL